MNESIVIIGMNIRPFTRSAVMAGSDVLALGVIGLLDIPAQARYLSLMNDLGGLFPIDPDSFHNRLVQAAKEQTARSLVYSGGFENYADLIAELQTAGLELLGNSPDTLRRVRDPFQLKEAVLSAGLATPEILAPGSMPDPDRKWLRKPVSSGAGQAIEPWEDVVPDDPQFIVQRWIDGPARSVSFVANGSEARIFAYARQLSGDPAFGGQGFSYNGNLLLPPPAPDLLARLNRLANALTQTFGLVGLNGVDFVENDGQIYVLEVNPRYSASMELVEDAQGGSLFPWHVAGCRRQPLPDLPVWPNSKVFGKATIIARQEGVLPDTSQWAARGWRDILPAGLPIFPRFPLATVTASGRDGQQCYNQLKVQADQVLQAVGQG